MGETEAALEPQSYSMSIHCSLPELGPICRVPGEVEAEGHWKERFGLSPWPKGTYLPDTGVAVPSPPHHKAGGAAPTCILPVAQCTWSHLVLPQS